MPVQNLQNVCRQLRSQQIERVKKHLPIDTIALHFRVLSKSWSQPFLSAKPRLKIHIPLEVFPCFQFLNFLETSSLPASFPPFLGIQIPPWVWPGEASRVSSPSLAFKSFPLFFYFFVLQQSSPPHLLPSPLSPLSKGSCSCDYNCQHLFSFPQLPQWLSGKESTCKCRRFQRLSVWSLGGEDPLEEEIVTCSSILAWRIPRTKQSGRLQSIASQRVRLTEQLGTHFSFAEIVGKGTWNGQMIKAIAVQSLSHVWLFVTPCETPGFPVLHNLLELTQTHVHWDSDDIQPSQPLSPLSPPAFNLSQNQGLF